MEPLALAQDENQFIYNGFQGAPLHLAGNAKIHPHGLLQLTNTSKQITGYAFYPIPLKLNTSSPGLPNSLSFSTNFIFSMIPELPKLSGHGMAFIISPTMDFSSAVASQYLGLFNTSNNGLSSNHVFAVEFDTVLSPDLKDIDNNHVGIDVNGVVSNESAPATYFSEKQEKNESLKLISGDLIQVWIDYDQVEKLVNVTLAPIKTPKPTQPLLSTPIDLSLILSDSMYVGFSAATGSMASDHYILGWSFNKSGQARSLELSKLPSAPARRKSRKRLSQNMAILLISVSVSVIAIALAACIVRRRRYQELREDWEQEYGPQRFSYKDLYKATNGFKDKEILGAGGCGKVYRGVLPSSGVQVAVKRFSHDSNHGLQEFVAEIASMGRLRHRNLVQLLGYCRRKGELLLVYDYMPNGSLDEFLFSNGKPNLSWLQRYKILRGVASALIYLHEEWEQVVLHRDVKASNVLLDADLNGRLGDFGLARLYDHGANFQTTHAVGTIGYLAPELTRSGKATTSSDVFAFGALMLEMACGRRPVELRGLPEEMILVDWVFECWKKRQLLQASDPRLEGYYVAEEMELVLKLGLLCSHSKPACRPTMRQVARCLDGDAILPEIPPDCADIGMLSTSNEASGDLFASLASSIGKASARSLSSNDSYRGEIKNISMLSIH